MHIVLIVLLAIAAFGVPGLADAREFRRAQRIPGPEVLSVGPATQLPPLQGAAISDGQIPIPRRDVKRALQKVFDDWGTGGLRGKLSWNFVSGDRLADAVRSFAPRDARVRVQGVANIQINEQAILRGQAPDGRDMLVSRVSTTATTQVEFISRTSQNFSNLQGTNDFVLQIFHAIEQVK